MGNNQPAKNKKILLLNVLFVVIIAAIITFLALAPKETTPYLPHDDLHRDFLKIESKKQAEQFCAACHNENGTAPLSQQHPPKFRCLFCHKRK